MPNKKKIKKNPSEFECYFSLVFSKFQLSFIMTSIVQRKCTKRIEMSEAFVRKFWKLPQLGVHSAVRKLWKLFFQKCTNSSFHYGMEKLGRN